MCAGCEPLGLCRTPECPLRPVSPLRLQTGGRMAEPPTVAPGRWGSAGASERWSEHMRERWQDPAWRESQSARQRAAWDRLSPEQRHERGVATEQGRRRRRVAP